jgi:ubiquinone/menaquinone biosynthesis C-methylase UbiE
MSNKGVSEYLIKNYGNYYEDSDVEWRRLGALDKSNNILDLCSHIPHNKILEIGAGDGAILQQLADKKFGKELFALEIVDSAISKIRSMDIPSLVECKLYDGYSIPYEDDSFDLVILSHVIEHLEFPRQLLYEAQRAAKHVFIEVPLEDTIRLPLDYNFTSTGHINSYSYKTFRRLVQSSNLEVIQQEIINPSIEVLAYKYGKKGYIQYYLREISLRLFPRFAGTIFTFHSSILCK